MDKDSNLSPRTTNVSGFNRFKASAKPITPTPIDLAIPIAESEEYQSVQ